MAEGSATPAPAGSSAKSERTLSNWALASYGAPAMPLSMVSLPMAVYLPAVYADSEGFGLGLAFVGLVMVLSRVFDGVTDPLIGFLSDRNPAPPGGPTQTLRGDWHSHLYRRYLSAVYPAD